MPPLPPALLLKRNPAKRASESHLQKGIQNPTKSRGAAGTQHNPEYAPRGSSSIWQILHTLLNILPGITYIYVYMGEVSAQKARAI